MYALPRALFLGLWLAAVLLGVVEAINLGLSADLRAVDRALALAYVIAPFAVFGLAVAGTTSALAGLYARARRLSTQRDRPPNRAADAGAALLAVGAFAAVIYLTTRLLIAYTHNRVIGAAALALSTPIAACGALYTWAVLRDRLNRLDERVGPRASKLLTGTLITGGLLAVLLTIVGNDALMERLGGWPAAFMVAYPLLTLALTRGLSRLFTRRPGSSRGRRLVLVAAIVASLGLIDLVVNLDARAAVKKALLHETLVFQPLVLITQPLFDGDGDGYAGRLGGGDCDDDNPEVNPGAREIPRNSLDDDCFGGDSPGTPGATPLEPTAEGDTPAPADARAKLVPRPNIILITIDTLRADRLGYAGHDRPVSPRLDALAEDNLRFTWAFSQGAQTKASMPSLFTGRYFSEVDRTPDLWAAIHPSNTTLAERLEAVGYRNAGVPSHRFFLPGYGLNQGFAEWDLRIVDRYQTRMPQEITGHLVSDAAIEWLGARDPQGPPFLLWLHYFDPHHFYQDHPDIDFGTEASDLYDEEILYTDRQIGRLLDALAQGPHAERTYIVVHSDHGEGFWTHGYRYHGQNLYNDQLRVPLIIAGPGIESRQVDTPVSLIDVKPTLLDLAGVPIPDELHGMSLLPYATGGTIPVAPPVFAEMVKDATHSDRRTIIDWPWKLHYSLTTNEYRLFDLSRDPDELDDLVDREPEVFARMQKRLREWMSEVVQPSRPRR